MCARNIHYWQGAPTPLSWTANIKTTWIGTTTRTTQRLAVAAERCCTVWLEILLSCRPRRESFSATPTYVSNTACTVHVTSTCSTERPKRVNLASSDDCYQQRSDLTRLETVATFIVNTFFTLHCVPCSIQVVDVNNHVHMPRDR